MIIPNIFVTLPPHKVSDMKNCNKYGLTALVLTVLIVAACGSKKESGKTENGDLISMEPILPGDSTIYGLACDGCNDTILVFLPRQGGDPDTFNILNASKNHQVFGRPMIGDLVGVLTNRENQKVADKVINIEQLKGKWCYMVEPKLREIAGMPQSRLHGEQREEMDSILRELLQPHEFGVEIKGDYTARPIGMVRSMTSDEESPVVYPPLKRYREWRIFNGRLILSEAERDSLGNTIVTNSDTAQLVLLHRDTLVLRFNEGEQGYYRKADPL